MVMIFFKDFPGHGRKMSPEAWQLVGGDQGCRDGDLDGQEMCESDSGESRSSLQHLPVRARPRLLLSRTSTPAGIGGLSIGNSKVQKGKLQSCN